MILPAPADRSDAERYALEAGITVRGGAVSDPYTSQRSATSAATPEDGSARKQELEPSVDAASSRVIDPPPATHSFALLGAESDPRESSAGSRP